MTSPLIKTPLTTLVTGATSGIGLHLAHEFAADGHPLILVAPELSELKAVASTLGDQHGISPQIISCDLEDPEQIDQLVRRLDGREVDVLVNNAGHGQRGRFWEVPIEKHMSILRLNIAAVIHLTAHLLPSMVQRNRGGLLNVASIAAFEPGPTLAVYHASKAFVLSWSEAIATELEGTEVSVTTLCPGPTDTDFFEKADLENSRAFQQANLMAPQEVASIGYQAFLKKERVTVAGALNKIMTASRHLMPERAQAAKNEKLYEDVAPEDRKRQRGDKEAGFGERAS